MQKWGQKWKSIVQITEHAAYGKTMENLRIESM